MEIIGNEKNKMENNQNKEPNNIKPQIIVGIDPDVEKSGVAYLDCKSRKLEITSLSFPQLLDYLQYIKRQAVINSTIYKIVIEAGWLNKSNWHVKQYDKASIIAAKGNSTGRNHETGRKIEEMCRYWGMPVELIKPLRKMWKGKDGKITQEELAYFTGITGRTSQDGRDAALLAWNYAGFPIKINVKK